MMDGVHLAFLYGSLWLGDTGCGQFGEVLLAILREECTKLIRIDPHRRVRYALNLHLLKGCLILVWHDFDFLLDSLRSQWGLYIVPRGSVERGEATNRLTSGSTIENILPILNLVRLFDLRVRNLREGQEADAGIGHELVHVFFFQDFIKPDSKLKHLQSPRSSINPLITRILTLSKIQQHIETITSIIGISIINLTIMADPNRSSVTSPSIISIKNILSRIRDEINMRTITVSIRQYCIEEQQIKSKDRLLNFFLQCESKLKRHSNHEWNRVIEAEIKKMIGLELLHAFHMRQIGRKFMEIISSKVEVTEQSRMESRLYQELGDLKDLQISDDIKVKTKFFFKWCKYLEERRAIKRLKNKQIEDLKKAKVFNQYSLKFQSFMQFKLYVRKVKLCGEKEKTIQANAHKRLLQRVFAQIKEKVEVLNIEQLLQNVVRDKLQQVHIKSVFGMLRNNKKRQQEWAKLCKLKDNVWVYRFCHFLTKKMHPLMNKSALQSRNCMERAYKEHCKKKCWKGLFQQIQIKNQQIKQIRNFIKGVNIKKFIEIKKTLKTIKIGLKKVKQQHNKNQIRLFFDCIDEGSKIEQSHLEKITLTHKYLRNQALLAIISKTKQTRTCMNELAIKTKSFQTVTISSRKHQFMKNLAVLARKRVEIHNNIIGTRSMYLIKTLMKRFEAYVDHKKTVKQIKSEMKIHHELYLSKIAWKGLSLYKRVKANEHQVLSNTYRMLQMKIKQQTFQTLKIRKFNMLCLQKLIKKSEYIALKVSFITILNRMLSNKMKIKSFYHKQDLNLKRKLFDMLVGNSTNIKQNQQKIKELNLKYAKKRFIRSIIDMKEENMKIEKVYEEQEKQEKRKFFRKIIDIKQRLNDQQVKSGEVSALIRCNRMTDFMEICCSILNFKDEQNRKIFKIQKNTVKGYIRSIRKFVVNTRQQKNTNFQKQELHNQKIKSIQVILKTFSLNTLLRTKESTIASKTAEIIKMKYANFIKMMRFNCKSKGLKKVLNTKKAKELIEQLKQKHYVKEKYDKLIKKMKRNRTKKAISTFHDNCIDIAQERQDKQIYLKEKLQQRRENFAKTTLLNRLKKHQQLKQNSLNLMNVLLRQKFSQIFKNYLSSKSKSIKQLIALRHYASNIKRKGFRCMKRAMNASLLKQNRVKTEYNSKLSMQKSIDNARRKSKLLQTIERYNLSRVSRVVR